MTNQQNTSQAIAVKQTLRVATFSIIFVVLAVALPLLAHQFHLAGPTFLPMHLFVLVAGLSLGWRVGLIVGLFTPIISYTVSGLPPLSFLPQITIEIMTYGFVAGLFRQQKWPLFWSLIGAQVMGRLALGLGVFLLGKNLGQATAHVWQVIIVGWPGIGMQLLLVPLLVALINRWLKPHFLSKV